MADAVPHEAEGSLAEPFEDAWGGAGETDGQDTRGSKGL